jgi:hypothetical protein
MPSMFSCVSVVRKNVPEIIKCRGHATIPSYVTILDDKRLIGHDSKDAPAKYAASTIYDVKRFIGSTYNDGHAELSKSLPYDIVEVKKKPKIKVRRCCCASLRVHTAAYSHHTFIYDRSLRREGRLNSMIQRTYPRSLYGT